MMAVPVTIKGSTLELGTPAALFSTQISGGTFRFEYLVARDGRFMVTRSAAEIPPPPITVILNARL